MIEQLELKKWYIVKELARERGIPKNLTDRVGTIQIVRELIKQKPAFIMQIMRYMIPFSIEVYPKNGYIEYTCYSALFDAIKVNKARVFPLYQIGQANVERLNKQELVITKVREMIPVNRIVSLQQPN